MLMPIEQYGRNCEQTIATKPSIRRFELRSVNCSGWLNRDVRQQGAQNQSSVGVTPVECVETRWCATFTAGRALVRLVAPAELSPVILADPDDDIGLATAVGGSADAIVSGDAHLLGIGEFRGISIITPAVAVSRLEA
jgi:hypothetical protein